ncbi:hypothetical protein [Rhodococcus gannanensis]|uniref:Uncharacterized protein n=1 Tax=Rhodococcus gannanensis TaxID=1960308 RepID=A0ABW4P3Y7_9NOCA
MRAGPAPSYTSRQVVPTYRPTPGELLVPMLALVAALASPLFVSLPLAALVSATALGWVVRRARAGGRVYG